MNCNFTLYGPVHSGKSTLAGLMITRGKSPEELERMDRHIMEELGNEYDPSQRIAYYVDTAQDERRRDNRVNSIGTSKHLHYQKVSLGEGGGEILLIDSPGSRIHWKQNYRSSFLADIGVLVYDIASFRKLVNMEKDSSAYRKEKKNLLSHIKIWKNYKNLNYLIIAISKMDEETEKNSSFGGYNRILFANAITVIKSNPELQKIPIVPISIDVRNYKEHNIFTKSLEMKWYSGKTLMETIKEKIEYFCKNDMSAPYTFANVVQKLRIKETKEPVFRIKVLSGEVRKGDILQITQVAKNKVSDYAMGEARVKSLKSDKGERTDIFVKGMIGGVTLSKIKINGKAASAEDLQLSRASYLVGCETKIKIGNILCLKSEKNPEEFYNFNMRDKVNLLMFGKIISTILVGKYRKDDGFYLYVYTKNYPLAMPVGEDETMILPNYVIEKENMDFLAVQLMNVLMIQKDYWCILQVEFDSKQLEQEKIENMFQGLPLKEQENNIWRFKVTLDDIEFVVSRLRLVFRRNHIVEFSSQILGTYSNE